MQYLIGIGGIAGTGIFALLIDKLLPCCRSKDRLRLHNIDGSECSKTDQLKKGISAVKHHVFRPSLWSFNCIFAGNIQTLISTPQGAYSSIFKGDLKYDKREEFTFQDGGKIFIDYMGDFVTDTQKPVIFIIPGLTSHAQTDYIQTMVKTAKGRGYNIVIINYRGLGGIDLYTPQVYCSFAYKDVLEPMTYVHEKYCKDRKSYAVGTSMGANILANMMGFTGKDCFLEAACVVQAPIKKWECSETIRTSMFGVYNKVLGSNLKKAFLRHEPMLKDVFREKIGHDMLMYVQESEGSVLQIDNDITAPLFGWKDRDDYYRTSACVHRIPNIKVPSLFMNAIDDPIIGARAIDYEVFRSNPNVVLGTTQYGGHLGYHEDILSLDQWFMEPVLDFFDTFNQ